jgi:hypothetical protein
VRSVQLHDPRRRNWQTVLQGSMQGQGELDIRRLVLQPSGRYHGHVWFRRMWIEVWKRVKSTILGAIPGHDLRHDSPRL